MKGCGVELRVRDRLADERVDLAGFTGILVPGS